MHHAAFGEDRKIGGAASHVNHCDAEFPFVLAEHRLAGRQGLQDNADDIQSRPFHALDQILDRRHRAGDDVHIDLQMGSRHTQGITNAILFINNEFAWQHMEDSMVRFDDGS